MNQSIGINDFCLDVLRSDSVLVAAGSVALHYITCITTYLCGVMLRARNKTMRVCAVL